MEGVRVFSLDDWVGSGIDATSYAAMDLKKSLEGLAQHLFGRIKTLSCATSVNNTLACECLLTSCVCHSIICITSIMWNVQVRWICAGLILTFRSQIHHSNWRYILRFVNPNTIQYACYFELHAFKHLLFQLETNVLALSWDLLKDLLVYLLKADIQILRLSSSCVLKECTVI